MKRKLIRLLSVLMTMATLMSVLSVGALASTLEDSAASEQSQSQPGTYDVVAGDPDVSCWSGYIHFTAPQAGSYTISTHSTDPEKDGLLLKIYYGDDTDAEAEQKEGNGENCSITAELTEGSTYLIEVHTTNMTEKIEVPVEIAFNGEPGANEETNTDGEPGANEETNTDGEPGTNEETNTDGETNASLECGDYIIYSALGNNMCVDIEGSNNGMAVGDNVHIYSDSTAAYNVFTLIKDESTNSYIIKTKISGLVLDVAGGSKENGANITQYASNDTLAQRWVFVPADNGYYYIRCLGGQYMDVQDAVAANNTNVCSREFTGAANQQFMMYLLDPNDPRAAVEPVDTSNLCGSDGEVHWKLEGDTLRIYGHGNMRDFSGWRDTPWYECDAYERVRHIIVEDGISRIGDYAFAYFYYVEDIRLGKDLLSIGKYAFYQATYYAKEYVFDMEGYASQRIDRFLGRYDISFDHRVDLVIPSSVYEIGEYAFSEAMHLGAVYIRWDFTTAPWYIHDWGISGLHIGECAFSECERLTTLAIGNLGKTSGEDDWNIWLEAYAFYYCPKLETVYLADTVSAIYEGAFYYCDALKNINYFGSAEKYSRIDISSYNASFVNAAQNIRYRDIKNEPLKHDKYNHWYEIDNNSFLRLGVTPHELVCVVGEPYAVSGDLFSYRKHCDICGEISDETFSVFDSPTVPRLTADTTALSGGVYIVDSQLDLGSTRLDVSGCVNLFLKDGCGFTTSGGIHICKNATLNVYSESIDLEDPSKMGYIKVTGAPYNCAGIGGNFEGYCINININGGYIEARGGGKAAGIGLGNSGDLGFITINDGYIRAWGGDHGAGIGSGIKATDHCPSSEVYINGGYVEARGGTEASGIGCTLGSHAYVKILGGTIKAWGGFCSAGIGAGRQYTSSVNKYTMGSGTAEVEIGDKAIILVNAAGSMLSEGNVWIVIAVAVAAIGGVAALVIVKKKKKPALANGAEKDDD